MALKSGEMHCSAIEWRCISPGFFAFCPYTTDSPRVSIRMVNHSPGGLFLLLSFEGNEFLRDNPYILLHEYNGKVSMGVIPDCSLGSSLLLTMCLPTCWRIQSST